MPVLAINYRFLMKKGCEELFSLEIDKSSLELMIPSLDSIPFWAGLDYHQCPNCPLEIAVHPHCPLCLRLAPIVGRFDSILSHDTMTVEVEMRERRIRQTTTAQRALGSLLGLVMAVSGCPHTVYFKPMARFHLPFATEEETIYRAVSMYLLARFYIRETGTAAGEGLEGLKEIYCNLHNVNMSIAERLRTATSTDSSVNAVIMLDMYTKSVPVVIDESLEEIRYLFQGYTDMPGG